MSDPHRIFIELGEKLSAEKNAAFDLWTWLPSYRAAKKAHGDHADTYTPSVHDVLVEAAAYIGHECNPTQENLSEQVYQCPCGETHESE